MEIEFEIAPEPTMDEVIASIEDVVGSINEAVYDLTARIEALEKKKETLLKESMKVTTTNETAKESLDDAIIESGALSDPKPFDLISKQEILAFLPKQTPHHWGYGPQELIRELKKKLES